MEVRCRCWIYICYAHLRPVGVRNRIGPLARATDTRPGSQQEVGTQESVHAFQRSSVPAFQGSGRWVGEEACLEAGVYGSLASSPERTRVNLVSRWVAGWLGGWGVGVSVWVCRCDGVGVGVGVIVRVSVAGETDETEKIRKIEEIEENRRIKKKQEDLS